MKHRREHNERGATLILAIVFIVVAGAIGGGLVTSLATGQYDRNSLDLARNREYAADGAIEKDIAQVRFNMTNGWVGSTPCPSPSLTPPKLNDVLITVDCTYVQTLTLSGLAQRNVTFLAHCTAVSGQICLNTDPIIRAQVNFQSNSALTANPITVDGTFVQSWSVET